jgi:hypothetical protein
MYAICLATYNYAITDIKNSGISWYFRQYKNNKHKEINGIHSIPLLYKCFFTFIFYDNSVYAEAPYNLYVLSI